MSYREDRLALLALMEQAAAIIQRHPQDEMLRLWATATDDLADALTSGALGTYDAELLRVAFENVSRRFWLEDRHSIRADLLKPGLTVIEGGEG